MWVSNNMISYYISYFIVKYFIIIGLIKILMVFSILYIDKSHTAIFKYVLLPAANRL